MASYKEKYPDRNKKPPLGACPSLIPRGLLLNLKWEKRRERQPTAN
jgi:hypothetical protein